MTLTAASIGGTIGKAALKAFLAALKKDRNNRYILNADFTLPALRVAVPYFEDDAVKFDGKIITIKKFAGKNDCDGNTLSPDKWKGKLLFGFIPHDIIYPRMEAIAKAWGVPVADVRLWVDGLYYSIMDAQGVPRLVSRLYYGGVRNFGGLWRSLKGAIAIAIIAAMIGGCGGCATPPENFFEDPGELKDPDVTKTAAITRPCVEFIL